MIELNNSNMLNIAITKHDAENLRLQLQELFVLDDGTSGSYYSMKEIEKKYPVVAELFKLLRV